MKIKQFLLAAIAVTTLVFSYVHARAATVALVGDESRHKIFAKLQNQTIFAQSGEPLKSNVKLLTPPAKAQLTEIADVIDDAEAVIIVVNVMDGPTAAFREQVIVARQAGASQLVVIFSNIQEFKRVIKYQVKELLKYETDEIASISKLYFGKDKATCFLYDDNVADITTVSNAPGYKSIASYINSVAEKTTPARNIQSGTIIGCSIYMLNTQEVNNGSTASLKPSDKFVLWTNKQTTPARLKLPEGGIAPGAAVDGSVILDASVKTYKPAKCLLIRDNTLVGVAVISDISETP